jgi:hypothetical protein
MPSSVLEALAERLDISEQMAENLLNAMLREVKNRARSGKGVRVPDLGVFRETESGTLTFEPSDELSRAVNERYEGLPSEAVAGAPDDDEDEAEEEDTWNPMDNPGATSEVLEGMSGGSGPSPSGDSDPPRPESDEGSTSPASPPADASLPEEPEPVDRESAAPAGPSASEDAASSASEDAADASPRDAASDDAGSEWPPSPSSTDADPAASASDAPASGGSDDSEDQNVGDSFDTLSPPQFGEDTRPAEASAPQDAPSEPSSAASEPGADAESDASEPESEDNFWTSDAEWEFSEVSFEDSADDVYEDDDYEDDDAEPESAAQAAPSADSTARGAPEEPERAPASSPKADSSSAAARSSAEESASGGSALQAIGIVLLLIAVAGGAWGVLAWQGLVPGPRSALQQTALLSSPGSTPSASSDPADASSSQSPEPSADAEGAASSASASQDDPSTASSPDAEADASTETGDAANRTGSASSFDQAAGGWTIVVSSQETRSAAESVAQTYRERLRGSDLPVSVLPSTVDGTTRYRVAVGQFSSEAQVRTARERHSDSLPGGAWPLQL